jgi:hypothetical protein
MAAAPALNRTVWDQWLSTITLHDTIPDIYSWHQLSDTELAIDTTKADFDTLRAEHDLPELPIDINEYAWPNEQNPAGSAWFIAQLERNEARGLRAHWGSAGALHDTMANIIFRPDEESEYEPNGEFYVYKYYADMSSGPQTRVETVASGDLKFDVFATTSGTSAKLLAGTRIIPGEYSLEVDGISALGVSAESGSINVRTWKFGWAGPVADTGGPVDLGVKQYTVADDKVRLFYDTVLTLQSLTISVDHHLDHRGQYDCLWV